MSNDNSYVPNPYPGYVEPELPTEVATPEQNTTTSGHFLMGLAAGAALAYVLSNKPLREAIVAKTGTMFSSARDEVEELKERLEDTQAELDYYRNLHKGE